MAVYTARYRCRPAAQRDRRQACGLQLLACIAELVEGGRGFDAVVREHLLVVEQHNGLDSAHRDAVILAIDLGGVKNGRQEVVLEFRILLHILIKRGAHIGASVLDHQSIRPIEENVWSRIGLRVRHDRLQLVLIIRACHQIKNSLDIGGLVVFVDQRPLHIRRT